MKLRIIQTLTFLIHSKWSWERDHGDSISQWIKDLWIAITMRGLPVNRWLFHETASNRTSLSFFRKKAKTKWEWWRVKDWRELSHYATTMSGHEKGNNISESSTNCFTFISVISFSRGKWEMVDFINFIKEGVTIVATYVFVWGSVVRKLCDGYVVMDSGKQVLVSKAWTQTWVEYRCNSRATCMAICIFQVESFLCSIHNRDCWQWHQMRRGK